MFNATLSHYFCETNLLFWKNVLIKMICRLFVHHTGRNGLPYECAISALKFFFPPHLSSSPAEMPSSRAPTTAAARCTTCAPTRRWLATRTAAWTPASRLWRSPIQAALFSPATTTSTATSGTHWRERKLVSGEIHSASEDETCLTKNFIYTHHERSDSQQQFWMELQSDKRHAEAEWNRKELTEVLQFYELCSLLVLINNLR